MRTKQILFGDEAKDRLYSGIDQISRAVGSTMGARGQTVLIQSENHVGGITSTKDGVTVAKAILLKDPTENMAVMLMRQAATQTASLAGDGTTTAIVLANAIIQEARKYLSDQETNITEVCRAISTHSESIIESLAGESIEVTEEILLQVATVSANNDTELGNIIGDAYNSVGKDGVVKVSNSKDTKTYSKETAGITFERGLLSPYLMTDFDKRKADHENCLILVTDLKIPSVQSIAHLVDYSIEVNKPLIIIGELEQDASATINHNVQKGHIKCCYVLPPSFGDRRNNLMSDIALATGGMYISERTGTSWESVTFKDLGTAERVVVDMETTSIIQNESENKAVSERVETLREQLAKSTAIEEKGALHERISALCGKVATIYVGADTDVEQKEKRDRVDDAVLATKAALDEGILPGGGVALLDQMDFPIDSESKASIIAADILGESLKSPFNTIIHNAGLSPDVIMADGNIGDGFGYNVKTDEFGDMLEMGIIDPAKVTKTALKNAVSVATTILMTSAIITNKD
jgi:chaperonin GroEL